jgi:uncharacterized protein YdeI (YjbR/CyaY-like superfamily)
MKINFFKSAAEFRGWLQANHARLDQSWIGFYKKDTGLGGLTYGQAVDEALCFGWIDGLKKRVDERRYTHRFSPRKPRSNWSRLNIQRLERLKKSGRMMPAGLSAYARRSPERSGIYSFENAPRAFTPADEKRFKSNKGAWEYFQGQPPGYRRRAIWWTTSAKQAATRARRLKQLITASQRKQRLGQFISSKPISSPGG